MNFIFLGLGFTTSRVAKRLLLRRARIWAKVRSEGSLKSLPSLQTRDFPGDATLVHTVPPGAPELRDFITSVAPARVIYISSTGVYGDQVDVDAATPARPCARFDEEQWIQAGPWSSLIVRPAAIYGPGRGVHMRVLEGRPARGAGSVVSRIHVDDLAAIVEAGALSDVTGAWPCADTRPASSEEISEWCARLLRITMSGREAVIPQSGRRVDGRAILDALGLSLVYPDYESGILASLAYREPVPAPPLPAGL